MKMTTRSKSARNASARYFMWQLTVEQIEGFGRETLWCCSWRWSKLDWLWKLSEDEHGTDDRKILIVAINYNFRDNARDFFFHVKKEIYSQRQRVQGKEKSGQMK